MISDYYNIIIRLIKLLLKITKNAYNLGLKLYHSQTFIYIYFVHNFRIRNEFLNTFSIIYHNNMLNFISKFISKFYF
jgi:hypothetical protein